jgi:iron only hydrogenase large subunit-like protein
MRKIKQGKCDYDYVELMACPSGCTNGGGQIKFKDFKGFSNNQELLAEIEKRLMQNR